jgi:RNA polymerase sigma-70 factor, ECF subfamily
VDDVDLIARAGRGDGEALGVLWSQHQHLLVRFLRGVGCTTPDDVASMVWIDVAKGLARFTGDATDFRKWLFTIARRRSIDELRRENRRSVTVDRSAMVDRAANALANDAAEMYERASALDRAVAVVQTLPPDQAEILMLRVVADLDVATVAAMVGKTEGNVRVIMHRALQHLATQLGVTPTPPETMNQVP